MDNQVETLIKDNKKMRQEIFSYEKLINEYKKQIKQVDISCTSALCISLRIVIPK